MRLATAEAGLGALDDTRRRRAQRQAPACFCGCRKHKAEGEARLPLRPLVGKSFQLLSPAAPSPHDHTHRPIAPRHSARTGRNAISL